MVKALEAVAVTVIEPPKLTDDPLIVIDEFVKALLDTPLNVPPSVKFPEVVTFPVRVNPLTVPVPLTEVTVPEPLLLNVFQSVEVKYPLTDVVAAGMLIAGVVPPDETTGAVPVTDVTVPTLVDPPKFTGVPLIVMEGFAICALVTVPLKSVVGTVAAAVMAKVPLPLT
jgi:hypothetical protein